MFGEALAGDPAWHMLLDLFVSAEVSEALSVSAACSGSLVPHSTAHRYLNLLEERGLLVRAANGEDRRRQDVRLTDAGIATMRDLLA